MKQLLLFCLILSTTLLSANSRDGVSAMAKVDTNAMLIGDQIEFTIEVIQPKNTEVKWPFLVDSIGSFEIVNHTNIDTTQIDDRNIKTSQKIFLTNWDSGSYFIPSLNFKYKNKRNRNRNIRSNAIKIDVTNLNTPQQEGIMPNKPIKAIPFLWHEAIPYIIWVLAILAALAIFAFILFFIYKRWSKPEEIYIPPRPPHEIALEKLAKLKKEKAWQQGEIKWYYSDLTEIIREYLEGRFRFQALESTTDEIVSDLNGTDVAAGLINRMKRLFEMSDLVKFAKAKPATENHLQSLKDAEAFVQHTKVKQQIVETPA